MPGRVLDVYTSLPFQGDLASRSRDVYAAEQLALAEAGGRAGRYRVHLAPLDDSTLDAGRWDPNQVVANARRATQDPRTIAYIGELDTGASAVSIPVLDQKGILQVSPADGLAGLTRREGATRGEPEKYYPDPRRNFARIAPPDNRQAAAIAAYMKELGVTRLYVVNDGGGYGVAMADAVVANATALGIGVVTNDTITPQGADYRRRRPKDRAHGSRRGVLRRDRPRSRGGTVGGPAHDRAPPEALGPQCARAARLLRAARTGGCVRIPRGSVHPAARPLADVPLVRRSRFGAPTIIRPTATRSTATRPCGWCWGRCIARGATPTTAGA